MKEFTKLRPHKRGEMDKPELFFEQCVVGVPQYGSRLRCWFFKFELKQFQQELEIPIQHMTLAIQELKGNANLKIVLGYVLILGNHLNAGTAQGSAEGFNIESLDLLEETKDPSNSISLFQFLCQTVRKNHPGAIKLADEFPYVLESSKHSLGSADHSMENLRTNLKSICSPLLIVIMILL